ncbi:MAG: glycosyltransferase family 39 protein, partial [Candidatus Neomarinimicrobiota bacterium]
MASPTPRRRLALLVGLLFFSALFVRLGYQYQMSSSPLWQTPILDEAVNHHWALEVARGEGWGEIPFFRAPLYPWFLGLVYGVVGESPAGARLVQALLSSFTCLLAWWIARRTFSPLAGWCAGVLAATYWPWVYFDAELQDVPLGLFWNLAALAVLVTWSPRRRHGWLPPAAGLLLGLSAITRPTVLVVLPAVA